MAAHEVAEAMQRARENVPSVIRALMRVTATNQATLGTALGLGQRDISYRLKHPHALSADELAGIAQFFGVEVSTLFKAEREALADFFLNRAIPGFINTPSVAA